MSDDLVAQLSRTALCQGLTAAELGRLVECGRVEYWPEGALVMEEGTRGTRVIVLLQGRVDICKHDPTPRSGGRGRGDLRVIAEVGSGGVLGEMSLVDDEPRSATVRAAEPLRVFAMDRARFLEMVDEGDPAALKLGFAIARVLARRVSALNGKVLELIDHLPDDQPLRELAEYRHRLFTTWEF